MVLGSTFGYGPPGPTHPFGTPYLFFLDSIRVLILFLIWANWMTMSLVLFKAYWRKRDGTEDNPSPLNEPRWLMLSVAILSGGLYVGETEWDHLGTPVGNGGRLWLGLVMSVLIFWWLARRHREMTSGVG